MNNLIQKISLRTTLLRLLFKKKVARMFTPNPKTRALFVMGHQRSGTTMLLEQLNKHIGVDVYHEDSKAMKNFRIRSMSYIRNIMKKSEAKIVVFKPLEDSHRTLEFLEMLTGSKAIWMFRHFSDVINSSMVQGWANHYKGYVTNICNQTYFAYSEPLNLTPENVNLVRQMYDPSDTPETCVALIWYLRNTIYFDYRMQDNEDVLLVQYEKLVSKPVEQIMRILSFVGLSYAESVSNGIHTKSIRKQPERNIRDDVRKLCGNCYEKLVDALKPGIR